MAILPPLEIELRDSTKGPRPISLDEYRKRKANNPTPQQSVAPPKPKTRGGKQVKLRREIANLNRLLVIADSNNRRVFLKKLRELKKQQTQQKRQRKVEQNIGQHNGALGQQQQQRDGNQQQQQSRFTGQQQ